MTKFSGISTNGSPALSDYLIGVTSGNVDDRVSIQNLVNLILTTNLLSIPYKFRATKTTAQTPTSGTFTKIAFDNEQYDTGNNYDNATNYRFTAPVTGYYLVMGRTSIGSATNNRFLLCLYKNGVIHSRGSDGTASNPLGSSYADIVKLTANDYIEMWCYASTGVAFENTSDIAAFSASLFATA